MRNEELGFMNDVMFAIIRLVFVANNVSFE